MKESNECIRRDWKDFFKSEMKTHYVGLGMLFVVLILVGLTLPAFKAISSPNQSLKIRVTNTYQEVTGYKHIRTDRYILGENELGEFTVQVTPRGYINTKIGDEVTFSDMAWSEIYRLADNKQTRERIMQAIPSEYRWVMKYDNWIAGSFIIDFLLIVIGLAISLYRFSELTIRHLSKTSSGHWYCASKTRKTIYWVNVLEWSLIIAIILLIVFI